MSQIQNVNCIVDKRVDIGSKNGNLLLNVPPRADGALDDNAIEFLEGIGEWMEIRCIYNTRPSLVYGKGPKREMGHMDNTSPYDKK